MPSGSQSGDKEPCLRVAVAISHCRLADWYTDIVHLGREVECDRLAM
jgi:hypothetical protein